MPAKRRKRILNMGTAQAVYCERQQQTMGKAALPTA
jgi:hypothetical protein